MKQDMNNIFEFVEDEKYFANILCNGDIGILESKYSKMFDFRSPIVKRKEFNVIRNKIYSELVTKYGKICMLKMHPDCSPEKKLVVDHLIPLSSNILNKKLRGLKAELGKKVKSQSFGSNNVSNLILACERCNSYKKHNLPDKNLFQEVNCFKN